nr:MULTISPECIES: T9SS type A sorting domain-containing protein [unclassified Aquimarina]
MISTEDISFSIFPNPVQGSIMNVFMGDKNAANETSNFEIKNFIGQLVGKGTVKNTIDVSNLKTGVYFLQVTTKNQGTTTKRFVKK